MTPVNLKSPGGQILPVCYSNPLAQAWRLPNFEAPRVNLRWTYAQSFTVAASSTLFNQIIPIDGNADFLLRELAFDTTSSASTGVIRIRFKDGQGKRLSHDLLAIEELRGPCPINQPFLKGTQVFMDIQNLDAVPTTVQVILKGIEVWERLGINTCMPGFEPEEYCPLYERYSIPPPGWHDEPYDYFFTIGATSQQSQEGLPLPMDSDADFYARGIAGYQSGGGLQKFRFLDAWQNQLSSDYVFGQNEFGPAPQARPIYPEICCPAYAVLNVDAIEYNHQTASARFALRGVKRFKD